MRLLLTILLLPFTFMTYGAEVTLNSRLEGSSISSGQILAIADADFVSLNSGMFSDARAFGYIRLGLGEVPNMAYLTGSTTYTVNLTVTPYSNTGAVGMPFAVQMQGVYTNVGNGGITVDADDYRMEGIYRFTVKVDNVVMSSGSVVPNFVYLEAGFYAERYYTFDDAQIPVAYHNFLSYSSSGVVTSSAPTVNPNPTVAGTDELELSWGYVSGAEYYDVEWTWVDNYSETSLGSVAARNTVPMSEADFSRNCTRIRTGNQHYRIPNVFGRGYLVYRVRGVGRWADALGKDKYGKWSSEDAFSEVYVSDWNSVITIGTSHEGKKNWQYQATYAEDGRKKEVTQYYDGTLRSRQIVTRINSDNHSVAGETIYDNEGRAVVEVLPAPQLNPALKYYPKLNTNGTNIPYSHQDFDWENEEQEVCVAPPSHPMGSVSGASNYYSTNAHTADADWQQYVPDAEGYPFTQVEYTPDNTGRVRSQGGAGATHKLGGGHDTKYYYQEPTQEELDRLFGYKIGYKQRYKKNMVVDANGQVSISYLDAQDRVIASALSGENPVPLQGLESKDGPQHQEMGVDLLNKLEADDVNTPLDDNELASTGRFGVEQDALEAGLQLGVPFTAPYTFTYSAESGVYSVSCDNDTRTYPFVYDLILSLKDDCGTEYFSQTYPGLGTEQIGGTTGGTITFTPPAIDLSQGNFTLYKEIRVNEQALAAYKADFVSEANSCIFPAAAFYDSVDIECSYSCQECVADLGSVEDYLIEMALDEGHLLSPEETTAYTLIYNQLLDACIEPCQPLTFCDVYYKAMLSDFHPLGQYGGTDPSDVLSIFNVNNKLTGDWKVPVGGYKDQNGNDAVVTVQFDGTVYSPLLVSGTDPAATGGHLPGLYPVAPEKLQHAADFIAVFQPSWAQALIPYHPEYALFQYTQDMCDLTQVIDASSETSTEPFEVSSDLFDNMVRQAETYAEARDLETTLNGSDFYAIDLLQSGDLDVIDPFFTQSYAKHTAAYSLGTQLKNNLMDWAMNDYENSGYTLLQFAYKTVICGNDNNGSCTVPSGLSWSDVATTYSSHADAIWQTYKSYYLSYKGKINQLFMDLHGFSSSLPREYVVPTLPSATYVTLSSGIFNGAIGAGGVSNGIAPAFSPDITNFFSFIPSTPTVMAAVWGVYSRSTYGSGWSITYGPNALAGPEYNSKQARITRIDAQYNASLPDGAIIDELSEDADFAVWSSTGLCPLTFDMESLLRKLATQDLLVGITNEMDATPELSPDIYQAFTGAAPSSSSTMDVTGSISLGALNLTFTEGPSSYVVTLPELSPLFPWATYGGTTGWHIYDVLHSYPVPSSNNVQVIMVVGTSPSQTQEFVVTYLSPVNLNGCQQEYEAQLQSGEPCGKEEIFEGAMLDLMQRLRQSGELINTSPYSLSGVSEYAATDLPSHFNNTLSATWSSYNSTTTTLSLSTGPWAFEMLLDGLLPSGLDVTTNADDITSFDIVDNLIYLTVNSGGTLLYYTATYNYTVNGRKNSPLDFGCDCYETAALAGDFSALHPLEDKMLAVMNYLWQQPSVSDGTNSQELESLAPYLSCNTGTTRYYNVAKNTTNSTLVFRLGPAPLTGCNFTFNTAYWSNGSWLTVDHFSALSIDWEKNYTLTVHYTSGQQFTFKGKFNCLVLPEPCDDCLPEIEPPVSCSEEFASYESFMTSQFTTGFTAEEDTIFMEEYLVNDSVFCSNGYAYIFSAYQEYITSFNITDVMDPMYLTIQEFGATPMGYSNSKLAAAVAAYHSYEGDLEWHSYITDVYLVENAVCPSLSPGTSFPGGGVVIPCDQWETSVASVNMQNQSGIYVNQILASFTQDYITEAMATLKETFTMSYPDKEYHYTLYYYDRAGNLIQTVPPAGAVRLEPGASGTMSYDEIAQVRLSDPTAVLGTLNSETAAPDHTLETVYRYNSLNQLVYQVTPDGGESRFAYDRLGRLVLSQNAKQLAATPDRFSYTRYDNLGRVAEAGELSANQSLGINDKGRLTDGSGVEFGDYQGVNHSLFPANLAAGRFEVVHSVYDELRLASAVDIMVPAANNGTVMARMLFGSGYSGLSTRNRITATLYQEIYNANLNIYTNASFYDYDIHGNVKHLLQVNADANLVALNQHVKHVEYEYDLINSKINKVYYQKARKDQFIHRYHYDSDNRITHAETSKDDVYFEKDAKYFYYDHGPLARTEIGDKKIEAQDYAYTMQGWLKVVNGEKLTAADAMGRDGHTTGLNKYAGKDVYGYSLSYFSGDYQSAGVNSGMLPYSESLLSWQSGPNLYNGNIRGMFTSLKDHNEQDAYTGSSHNKYTYDQLNRIVGMEGFNTYIMGPGLVHDANGYSSSYSYDANGNLKTLGRYMNNGSSGPLEMDNFEYHYNAGNNQLSYVEDHAGATPTITSDIEPGQIINNYEYDVIGQLKKDVDADIDLITWTVTNKVKSVQKSDGTIISFVYNAFGHRISKKVTPALGAATSTFYVLDAAGNPLSMYEGKNEDGGYSLYLSERNLYGSSRLGSEQPNQLMTFEQMGEYLPLSPILLGDPCSTTGKWYYEVPSTSATLLDHNVDGITDVKFICTNTNIAPPTTGYGTGFSSQTGMNVVGGQPYTLDFDYLASTNLTFFGVAVYDCGTGQILYNDNTSRTIGHQSVSFTPAYGTQKVRIKWLADRPNATAGSFTISQILGQGQGTEFDAIAPPSKYHATNKVGDKYYELTDHLGNVLDVVRDRKLASNTSGGSIVTSFIPDVASYSDYFPFGMTNPQKQGTDGSGYRYGFNGMEQDDEIKGNDNSYDFGDRIYDPRIGRWLSIDGFTKKFPWWTPYQFSGNSPIWAKDLEGLEGDKPVDPANQKIVIKADDPYKDTKTVGDWSLTEVLTASIANTRINGQINKLADTWTIRTDESGINATRIQMDGSGLKEIVLKVGQKEDLKTSMLSVSWEVVNALNFIRFDEMNAKALKADNKEAGGISRDDYILALCRIEADASINREIMSYALKIIPVPKGWTIPTIIKHFEKNYEEIADKEGKRIRDHGVNGAGVPHKIAYGIQYDEIRKRAAEAAAKALEESKASGSSTPATSTSPPGSTTTPVGP